MRLLAGVALGFVLGLFIQFARAQGPDPCFLLTFTPSPQATQTTVALPTATHPPSLTPTYDFATHTIFQTATAMKQANLTQEAKWTRTPNFFPTPTLEELSTPSPVPTPTSGGQYRIVAALGVNIRVAPSLTAVIVGHYRLGEVVTVTETRVINGYTWGKTSAGWVAIRTPAQALAELQSQ